MKQSTVSAVAKGVTAGAIIGTATYMMTHSKQKNGVDMKKNAGKALKAVGTAIENVSYMLK